MGAHFYTTSVQWALQNRFENVLLHVVRVKAIFPHDCKRAIHVRFQGPNASNLRLALSYRG